MDSLRYYAHSLSGYWPTARALSASVPSAVLLFFTLLAIPVRKRFFGRQPMRLVLSLGGQRIKYFVRDGTDISALREVFAGEEYLFKELPAVHPRHIADIGAHIGASVLYFHRAYPDAAITAYEPDPDNFALLQMNLASLPQVTCLRVAVAGRPGTIAFYPNVGGSTRSSVKRLPDAGEEIRVATVGLKEVIDRGADFIKFDTEGAEYDMCVSASPEDIRRVGRYLGEVHHALIGKTREQFERLFPGFSFSWKSRGVDHSIVAISIP
jgi:FkbM family methyltransferase